MACIHLRRWSGPLPPPGPVGPVAACIRGVAVVLVVLVPDVQVPPVLLLVCSHWFNLRSVMRNLRRSSACRARWRKKHWSTLLSLTMSNWTVQNRQLRFLASERALSVAWRSNAPHVRDLAHRLHAVCNRHPPLIRCESCVLVRVHEHPHLVEGDCMGLVVADVVRRGLPTQLVHPRAKSVLVCNPFKADDVAGVPWPIDREQPPVLRLAPLLSRILARPGFGPPRSPPFRTRRGLAA